MAWQIPKTNWIATDYYNFGDLNRVENNAQEITILMQGIFTPPVLTVITNRDITRIEFYDELNRIENNILTLRNAMYEPPGWIIPETGWYSLKSFGYIEANRLESDLLALYTMLQNIINYYQYCGTFTCGQDNTYL